MPITGRSQLNLLPESEMMGMSLTAYQEFLQQNQVLSATDARAAQVRRIGDRLAQAATSYFSNVGASDRVAGFQWEFHTVNDPTVNAWCMPGGKVVVYTGILPVTQDDAGLAVVMGHEIAHAIARHGNERMSQALAIQGAGMTLEALTASKPGLTRDIFLQSYGIGSQLGMLAYSRKDETEADKMGLVFMAMAGSGDPISADAFIRSRVTRALSSLLNNPWEEVHIDGVESTVKVSFSREVSMIRGTQALDLEVDPGEPVKIQIELMPFMAKSEKKVIEVPIPADLEGEEVEIEIAPGYEIERPRAAPESVTDLIAALRDPTYPEESLVATVRLKGQGGASFRGNVATRLPPGALDQLKTSATSIGPDTFGAVQQTSHPMKRFVVGRDRVRVKVRPNLK